MVRYFTLAEANALLPELTSRLSRALQLQMLIQRGINQLGAEDVHVTPALLAGHEHEDVSNDGEVVLERTRAAYEALYDEMERIEVLGVQLKGIEQGLVDFPTLLDGETEVLLCWQLGEPAVGFYHHPHAGFAGRRPVEGCSFQRARSRRPAIVEAGPIAPEPEAPGSSPRPHPGS